MLECFENSSAVSTKLDFILNWQFKRNYFTEALLMEMYYVIKYNPNTFYEYQLVNIYGLLWNRINEANIIIIIYKMYFKSKEV